MASSFDLERAARLLENIEQDMRALKQILYAEGMPKTAAAPAFMAPNEDQGIDGYFDGEKMLDESGKIYQVPANYASKSKLVEGDPLRLYVTPDGKYFFKQLGPVARVSVVGTLQAEGTHYIIVTEEGKTYDILTASVTYYMSLFGLQVGGQVTVLIPEEGEAHWAVIDNVL